MKVLQFELWQECNNRCKFCYLGQNILHTDTQQKIKALKDTINKIDCIDPSYEVVAFIGGEFFQGQLADPVVHELFFTLMHKTANLLNTGRLKEVWISVTLTIGQQKDLYKTIELFEDKSKLWLLTSWDSKWRFHSQKMSNTWEYHMKHLHELWPSLKLNTTIILTGDFIDKYLLNEFNLNSFSEEFNTAFFFKQPASGQIITASNNQEIKRKVNELMPNFFPTREQFLSFLLKFKQCEHSVNWSKLFNIEYRADDVYRNYNDGRTVKSHRYKGTVEETIEEAHLPCGHSINYDCYVDQPGCVMCDKHKVEAL